MLGAYVIVVSHAAKFVSLWMTIIPFVQLVLRFMLYIFIYICLYIFIYYI